VEIHYGPLDAFQDGFEELGATCFDLLDQLDIVHGP